MAEISTPPSSQSSLPALPVPAPVLQCEQTAPGRGVPVFLLGLLACLASLGLHVYSIFFSVLMADDFQILLASWTWKSALDHLWEPHNEQVFPLVRLWMGVLVELGGGRLTAMPDLGALHGPLAVLLGMGLVYLFVRRETGQPFYGLLALTFFGVSTQYNEAVTWFTAGVLLLALDTVLLALLAAQAWRQTGSLLSLACCVACVALAPGWFASGILAGPLCCLYLLPGRRWDLPPGLPPAPAQQAAPGRRGLVSLLLPPLVPFLGTLIYLGLVMARPSTFRRVVHTEHYAGATLLGAFKPLVGLVWGGRALVDRLVVGTLGFWEVVCPTAVVLVGLAVLAAFAVWWWRRAPHRRLLLLGLGFILCNNLLVYSFRAAWGYERLLTWSRYDLLPHLGLTLFLAGGLPARLGPPAATLTRRQALAVGLLTAVLFASQLPRGLLMRSNCNYPEQMMVLQAIEEVDARCRQHRVAAETAHQALGKLFIPPFPDRDGIGFQFLRGSDDPLPLTVEEARRLLLE